MNIVPPPLSGKCAGPGPVTTVLVALLAGCAGWQDETDADLRGLGFEPARVMGEGFTHTVYERGLSTAGDAALHIYIGGDGTPWVAGRYPATDPTPRRPVVPGLMAEDPAPAVFVGRPCYHDMAVDLERCDPQQWTSARYSRAVVDSMLAVIRHYQVRYAPDRLLLVGYSGGGSLATLVAPRLDGDVFLVTIAANLDTRLWAESHDYLPLTGSLNPVDFKDDARRIPQLHLVGTLDRQVPVEVIRSYTRDLPPEAVREYQDADHSCCWVGIWRDILAEQPWR